MIYQYEVSPFTYPALVAWVAHTLASSAHGASIVRTKRVHFSNRPGYWTKRAKAIAVHDTLSMLACLLYMPYVADPNGDYARVSLPKVTAENDGRQKKKSRVVLLRGRSMTIAQMLTCHHWRGVGGSNLTS